MTTIIFLPGIMWLLLFITNIGIVVWINRRLVGSHYDLSCNGVFLSGVFAFIAVVIATIIFP